MVGSFTQGYVGECADEVHLARELEKLGHKVNKVPRDIWKAHCEGETNKDWDKYLKNLKADINIICKWHHFVDGKYCRLLREKSNAPVFYWTWDYMQWPQAPEWHRRMAEGADLHLTNEGGLEEVQTMNQWDIKHYYFPFDVSDGEFDKLHWSQKAFDVVFFGTYLQQGDRIEWLREINKQHPIDIFSWNFDKWKEEGFSARPAVYGDAFAEIVARSKICLQFSVNDHCWGYWSNRVGKILTTGGFLLARYTPGMELFLRDGAEYFSSPGEAIAKIDFYLKNDEKREKIARRGYKIGRDRFTSKARIKELDILIDRFLKGGI